VEDQTGKRGKFGEVQKGDIEGTVVNVWLANCNFASNRTLDSLLDSASVK